jgi:hypothetical protein
VQNPHYTEAEVAAALGGPVTRLGSGAFGETWRRDDTAVKIIFDGSYPPDRLQREVDGLGRVSSPHVVRLVGTRAVTLRGEQRPALVFEYIPGGDVAGRVFVGQLPSVDEAVEFLRGLLTGIRHMHEQQTVHRDIKPANIALRGGDWSRPVLLDLGLARGAGEATITAYPALVGTPAYTAGVNNADDLPGQHPGVPQHPRQRRDHVPRLDRAPGRLRQERLISHVPARVHHGHRGLAPPRQPLQPPRRVHPDVTATHNQDLHDELLPYRSPVMTRAPGRT